MSQLFGAAASSMFGSRAVMAQRGSRMAYRSQRGVYAGRQVGWGNQISHSAKKHRRRWKPNVQHKVVRSDVMQRSFRLRVTMHALRSFDRAGGFDEYLLHTPWAKLDVGLTRTLRLMAESTLRRRAEEKAWADAPDAARAYAAAINTAPQLPALALPPPSAVALPGSGLGPVAPGAPGGSANPTFRYDRTRPAAPMREVPAPRYRRAVSAAELALLASESASPLITGYVTRVSRRRTATAAAPAEDVVTPAIAVPTDTRKSIDV